MTHASIASSSYEPNLNTGCNAVVEIYTDGGCEPNPGPGGYGVVVLHPKKRLLSSLSESQLKELQA